VAGCNIIVHSGTPFKLETENPQTEMFEPTVKGTENFLEAVSAAPTVQKVVFIASIAAHNTHFPLGAEGRDADHLYTKADTPFVSEASNPYAQAKYHADQVVRRFTQEHPNLPFEIVSVSPVIVVGQALSARQDSTSMGMQFLIQNKIAPNDFLQFLYDHDVELAMVDVDDVAEAVFQAATTSGLHGKHYLLSSERWKVSDTSLMLNRQAPVGNPRQVVSGRLAQQELGVRFKPAQVPLNQFGGDS